VLRSPQLIGEMGMRSKGIRPNQERLYWDDLAEIRIRVPGLDEQRQIADFLDDQVARIDALGTLRERQSELLLWQLHSARVEASLQVSQWVAPLRRATTCLDGRRIPVNAQERASMSGPYPYWGAGSIVDHVDRWLFDEPLVLLGEDGAPFFDPLRDVAFSVTGKIWVNNHIHVLRPLASHRPGYLGHMLNCVDYSSYITGSTRDKLTQDQMMSIRLPLPAPEAQLGIERSLDDFALEVASRRESLSRSSQLLGELKRSLISATVSGEFDVSAASGWGVRL
jgi:type I restriction enzyme S subunit